MEHRPSNLKAFTKELPEPGAHTARKVQRYRAGKVPEFAQDSETPLDTEDRHLPAEVAKGFKKERQRFSAKILTKDNTEPAKNENKSKRQPLTVIAAISDSESDSGSDDFDRRRAALKERLQRQTLHEEPVASEEIAMETNEAQQTTSASSTSEYESMTESETEEPGLLKPMFVPKTARKTLTMLASAENDQIERQKLEEKKLAARKASAKRLVAEELQQAQTQNEDGEEIDMPDDTDGMSPDEEYRAWEIRELKRIKRNRDKALLHEMEKMETERRRNLTQEEREAEDRKLEKNEPKEKTKWKYLQKYYHKGAFYVDDGSIQAIEDVRKRDASEATLEDKFDKELLPKVMQVKNFGRAGRTKYTHLVDQDTTGRDSLWSKSDEIRAKYSKRMGGVRNLDSQPMKKRKT